MAGVSFYSAVIITFIPSIIIVTTNTIMLKKGEHIEGVPTELQQLLDANQEAADFFGALSKSHKQGYIDWVGSAKAEATKQTRAGKALLMLNNKQKTLKTVKE